MAQPYIPRGGRPAKEVDRYRRNFRNEIRVWWREVDRVLLAVIGALVAIGIAAVAAASPASAGRLSTSETTLPDLYFYWAHLRWLFVGLPVMIGVSFLSRDHARQTGIILGLAMLIALMLVPLIGHEVNGARRWLKFGLTMQPSEFLKPAFAIVLAWIISWRMRDPKLPVIPIATSVMALVAGLLMLQPNLGDTILFAGVWFVLVLLSGISMQRIGALAAAGTALLTLTYLLYDNARYRIDSFFAGGTAYDQVDLAEKTLLAGGWTGTGFWMGLQKSRLPEAHTDYIFSVVGEEFGLIWCAIILALYLGMVARVLSRLVDEDNLFAMLAAAGLVTQISGQAFINILVNLQLFPSKGMTLPLISYGGSSTIAVCLAIGLLLAITRRNPFLTRENEGLGAVFANRSART
ncbi:putative peptidoglycan glycosyltransferase FtsW [Altererythrobacter aquiaggeris]|uniref:FtsW/RodA/SpoVE family cell cycle protein n=1 Tax=Aestuarierythrobacter aquiaggeris TaxID=1898396 RepID=UPI003018B0B0